jgi:hypothetical protein
VAAPLEGQRRGWRRLARLDEAGPGDLIAWLRPAWLKRNNTGHVAIVVAKAEPVEGGVLLRIVDSTSLPHADDTRSGTTGYGRGTIFVATDPLTGQGLGYGWEGRLSAERGWIIETHVVAGRPVR